MIETPHLAICDAAKTAVIHLCIPRADIMKVVGPAIQEVTAVMTQQDITPAGPWFSNHLRNDSGVFDFEVGLPVRGTVRAQGRVIGSAMESRKVIRTVYHGGYEGLERAWGEFMDWIAAHHYPTGTGFWEFYTHGPESGAPSEDWRTQLNVPLA